MAFKKHVKIKMHRLGFGLFIFTLLLFQACTKRNEPQRFDFFLHEPCMILNAEQNNTIEGNYLRVNKINLSSSLVELCLPTNFYINNNNKQNWVVGWGMQKPYYDTGTENLREIAQIGPDAIVLGELLRGRGFPEPNQSVVFWNKNPSGFINHQKKPIINTKEWPEFAGQSVHFSSVEFDEHINKWVMLFNEHDTTKIQVYAAVSDDLANWSPANKGRPVLTSAHFNHISWAGTDATNTFNQSPIITDMVFHQQQWYLFLDGYSADGKRHIGVAIAPYSLLGPYQVLKAPIISPGQPGSWNEKSCFFAKVKQYNEGFIMFYTGRTHQGVESVGMAKSTNLTQWQNYGGNPVLKDHVGWRSKKGASEPSYLEVRHDTIILLVGGTKQFNMDWWHRYVTRDMFVDKPGNVSDKQLGAYISYNGGKTFTAHKNNPVFTNDYTNVFENDHLGINFRSIKTDSVHFLFYQAKSGYQGFKYNVMLRQKRQ